MDEFGSFPTKKSQEQRKTCWFVGIWNGRILKLRPPPASIRKVINKKGVYWGGETIEESTCFFPSISLNRHILTYPDNSTWIGQVPTGCAGKFPQFFWGKCDMFYMCDHHVTLQIEMLNCIQKCFVRLTSWLSDFLFGPLSKKSHELVCCRSFEAVKKCPMIHQQEICYNSRSLFTKLWGVGDIMVIQSSVKK